ncbi:MAG: type II toxin-antitoxin system RelE/ParE family toxin, partial [Chromatiales bacterium]|nr:type II toxin-antitoxin system RelE/ParE family toxin [Chromatiales bacterium]
MTEVVITPLAEADLLGIWHYSFSNWGDRQADKYLFALETAIHGLADNPRLGRSIDHIRDGCRQFDYKMRIPAKATT